MWADGPEAYLGVAIAGLPNLFIITGPGSPSVLSNVVNSIEQHVEWIGECLAFMRSSNIEEIEADLDAQTAWMQHTDDVAQMTLFPRAKSWYSGDNVEGKPRRFAPYVGGHATYAEKLAAVRDNGYEGFRFKAEEPVRAQA
jgi:cyclohexanone monooxygenase